MKRRSAHLFVFALLAATQMAACSSSSPPKQAPKKAAAAGTGTGSDATQGPTTLDSGVKLGIERKDASALSFPSDQTVTIGFQLTGDTGKEVIVGLLETPKGPTLDHPAGTSNVTFAWASPAAGSQKIRFILRDKAKCAAEETDAARCDIKPQDFGVIGANDKYDVVSDEFTFEVTQAQPAQPSANTNPGTIPGGGANPLSGLGGGNSALIGQITGLLGGGGGGGAGNLQSLLGGLGGGQLQTLLGLVKGGTANAGNIGSIVQLLQGLGLTDGSAEEP